MILIISEDGKSGYALWRKVAEIGNSIGHQIVVRQANGVRNIENKIEECSELKNGDIVVIAIDRIDANIPQKYQNYSIYNILRHADIHCKSKGVKMYTTMYYSLEAVFLSYLYWMATKLIPVDTVVKRQGKKNKIIPHTIDPVIVQAFQDVQKVLWGDGDINDILEIQSMKSFMVKYGNSAFHLTLEKQLKLLLGFLTKGSTYSVRNNTLNECWLEDCQNCPYSKKLPKFHNKCMFCIKSKDFQWYNMAILPVNIAAKWGIKVSSNLQMLNANSVVVVPTINMPSAHQKIQDLYYNSILYDALPIMKKWI